MREIIASVIGGALYSTFLGGYMMIYSEEMTSLSRKLMMRNRL